MDKQFIIQQTAAYIKSKCINESSGHDWWHIYRVWNLAKKIAVKEGNGDLFVIELGSLLHDIADWKFHEGDEQKGPDAAADWLTKLDVDGDTIKNVCHIIANISYKGAGVNNTMKLSEGLIVQDADRLDALGAIGIARMFAYGGYTHRPLYIPNEHPIHHVSFEEYKQSKSSSFNHFYEKILLLKDMMNTKRGKMIAQRRHRFVENYINEFLHEWENQDV